LLSIYKFGLLIRDIVVTAVLKSLHLTAGLSDDTLSLTPKATEKTAAEGGIYNVKSDLMRLLTNLVYRHKANQHTVQFSYW